jgi:hypothetical protein
MGYCTKHAAENVKSHNAFELHLPSRSRRASGPLIATANKTFRDPVRPPLLQLLRKSASTSSRSYLDSYAETSAASLEQTTSSSSRLGATLSRRLRCSRTSLCSGLTTCTLQRTYATTSNFLCSLFGCGAAVVHEANIPCTMARLRTAATAEECGQRCLDGIVVLERQEAHDQPMFPTPAVESAFRVH